MSNVKQIKAPIAQNMKEFEVFFKKSIKSKVPLLSIITNYILRRKGKQMRPMIVFLVAKLLGEVNQSSYHAAALIELLHTATLVHDDVVDEAYERRSFFSINALWKSKVAVLVGDYLLSQGLLLSVKYQEFKMLGIVSEAVKEMSEGELIQIEKTRQLNITEEVYYEVIGKKTASLIAACAAAGASSVGASDAQIEQMKQLGTYMGIAFQIKDDLFDYEPKGIIGKPTGNDIKEKKMTLPLIYVVRNAPKKEQKRLLKTIKKHNNNAQKVQELIRYVADKGGLKYATEQMFQYKQKALNILAQFPDNEAKTSLSLLIDYVVNRKK